jgi:hypothetical protein
MDKELRNRLRNAVVRCRLILEDEVARQLEGTYGVRPDGTILAAEEFLASSDRSDEWNRKRDELLNAIAHIESGGAARKDAVEQFRRETAFTVINRLVALKLMEHPSRNLIQESVGHWKESRGFVLFQRVSPEVCRAARNGDVLDGGYRQYLECLFDDLSVELGVLFDASLPQSIVFPSENGLKQVLSILNEADLGPVWGEDETIGWVYQYFTPKELRDKTRKESPAPRNSYELAFLNQFYTPRYVVEFLTDNTLGRMWWEMRKGDTVLAARCRYLVRRKRSEFLKPDQSAPPDVNEHDTAEVEHIRHRIRRDPRDLKILDPACGSGHFLLYAYEQLEAIYEEAWSDPDSPISEATGRALRHDYPDQGSLRRAIPDLILRCNLYGTDIDLRATQIAALALWLRAQRSYQNLGLKISERPQIRKSNVVCAEPMPGEQDMLNEFVASLEPRLLGDLVREVFVRMKLAGEAGTLLGIERELREAIRAAKQRWERLPPPEQMKLWSEPQRRQADQGALFDVSGIPDARFWDEAEHRVVETLRRYAETTAGGDRYRRKLFAEDAEQGFALVDLLFNRYDVVLMNPPYGRASKASKAYIDKSYPRTKRDLYAVFVERALELLSPAGMLGALTSRTGFFLSRFQKWREELLLGEARPTVVADLGVGVLDTATVETAAYCLEKTA